MDIPTVEVIKAAEVTENHAVWEISTDRGPRVGGFCDKSMDEVVKQLIASYENIKQEATKVVVATNFDKEVLRTKIAPSIVCELSVV